MQHWHSKLVGRHPYRPWLTINGSLTAALKSRCPTLHVWRLRQELGRPGEDERTQLALDSRRLALIREVVLYCQDQPLVFAHSVIPRVGLAGPWRSLSRLGSRPLGEALFADPRIVRHPLKFRCLDARHPLYRSAVRTLTVRPPRLWARRSVFVRGGYPILVTEVFLPAVLHLTEKPHSLGKCDDLDRTPQCL